MSNIILSLPTFVAELTLPASITVSQANEILAIARGNLLAPAFAGYDPLSRHRPLTDGEENDYSSRFFAPSPEQAGIPAIEDGDEVTLEEGHGGKDKAVVLHVKKSTPVGVYYPVVVPENTMILCKKDPRGHGLVFVPTNTGYWGNIKPQETSEFSVVVYNTAGEEDAGWVIASAYPGPQDTEPDTTGLSDGDIITVEEARKRRLRVRKHL